MGNDCSERIDGPTPNGGAYAIAYFRDADGKPCSKDMATNIEIVEFDENGRDVFRTYGLCNK